MRCPQCHCLDDKVVDSRLNREGNGTRRRRECINCGHRFTTYEGIINAELKIVKKDKRREDFDLTKLRKGIDKACEKLPIKSEDIDKMLQRIISGVDADFDREVSSSELGNRIIKELRGINEVAYVRFASVYRQFKDIDEFIIEIKNLGRNNNDSA